QIPRIGLLHSGGTTGQIRPESPRWGRDSALPQKRAHSPSQAVTRGELLAAGDGVLRQKDPAVFLRGGHRMPEHHRAARYHLDHRISIAGRHLLTALPRKDPLFIGQGSAVLIAEEQGYRIFVDRILVRTAPPIDNVPPHVYGAPC